MRNLILHIPHSSTEIPSKEGYCITDEILNQEILKLTDWYTDDLFENEYDISIKAPFSRIFCDTERFSDNSQEVMAQFGMGVLYEKTDSGESLRNVTPELRKHILDNYYWKHHNWLTKNVQLQLEQYGKATIVDCHSFPSKPLNRVLDQSGYRPDFNIGTDAFHTPKGLIDASVAFYEEKGYSLGIDKPYCGSIVPIAYYQKNKNVQSIMLEINRGLYLNEQPNVKSIRYQEIKQIIQEFLNVIRCL
ncbi:N-formylglutamate amidohydrolase [Flavobacterium taihuense]|uniref:N-formylglutamate amidohydrolase n=1 Tax=Flavobacterium taihuense TaxID=2857508 RepID=A0ABS6XRZ2_9FLAO|nr:N-formylglutamate amidohydrolase [Flavobacterium taihuense]MBW4359379.1 N-formylglutamate amidohydrolase [Flavobacterium taihuense]